MVDCVEVGETRFYAAEDHPKHKARTKPVRRQAKPVYCVGRPSESIEHERSPCKDARFTERVGNNQNEILRFLKSKGFDDENIERMSKRCKYLECIERERACEVWDYMRTIGIPERKMLHLISKCPKILTLSLNEKLVPLVQCLSTLGTKSDEVATAITKFPHILFHSVEEKLCPLLALFQTIGISEKQMGKLILVNPRLISYSIDTKYAEMLDFLASLGLKRKGAINKILLKNSSIMGYSVVNRLRPTAEFLKSVGLNELDIQRVVVGFPEILCRDAEKILKPNLEFLQQSGFNNEQIRLLVTGYPPILIKSTRNSLQPRIKFLVEEMGRELGEVADYPEFFRHGLKRSLEFRHRLLRLNKIDCSLFEMLECKHKKFLAKFGLIEGRGLVVSNRPAFYSRAGRGLVSTRLRLETSYPPLLPINPVASTSSPFSSL
ncbi:hypothetical protein KSP39_PZI023051 [Platanthera zijinensis]|uniref:Uncharacterized protein n=1 Tax=Platanthera zijinensis TaxID=2320716 RepID=A0AAP0FV63_9ASPA